MTVAPPTLVALQNRLVTNLHTTNLGIIGDTAHVATGGYHIGAKTLRANGMSNDYSLEYPLDYRDISDNACAIDIGGTSTQLMSLGNRIVTALQRKDPRVYKRVRGVNASWGGVTIDRRYDCENPNNPADDNIQASSDRGHLHLEVYRTLVLRDDVMNGIYDVLAGVPLEDDMNLADYVPTGWQQKYYPSIPVTTRRITYGDVLLDTAAREISDVKVSAQDLAVDKEDLTVDKQDLTKDSAP